ncbi:MAG TPA: CHAD domain-containing protein [Gemmata sp.]|nr:CHAD domain-containing protein [Gemmata sp.]
MADGKWIEGLSPEMDVSVAAREVLIARCQVVRHCLPLAVEKSIEDSEYVHQLRVGTRRAAAALRVFADCLPRKHLKSARESLRLIRRAAGDARDWDVFLLGLPETKSLSTALGKPALDFLSGYAMSERLAAQARLVYAANAAADRFKQESEGLPELVHELKGDDAPKSFGDLAASQFGELLRLLTVAAEENPKTPPELHRLRILGKRVRYALEIFADCFPDTFRETVYPAVENIQELLGEVQDATVGLSRLVGLRDHVKQTIPAEWPRLRKGFEGLMQSMRAKVPAGRKAFQKWRKEWAELVQELKVEVAVAAVTA